jgi:hypothetical protein
MKRLVAGISAAPQASMLIFGWPNLAAINFITMQIASFVPNLQTTRMFSLC